MAVYLDAATSAPWHPVARQAFLASLDEGWADPGKLYSQSRKARQLLDAARGAVAEILAVRDDELHFTSSGTEAIRLAISGMTSRKKRVVHTAVEHSAVLKVTAEVAEPYEVPVDRLGRVDLAALESAVGVPGTALAAVQSANHEVGTRQPVAAAAELCTRSGVPLLVDAAQSVGRVPVPEGWSLMTASARKWGGPSGIGLLAVRKGTRWEPPSVTGPVDLPAAVAAAASLRAVAAARDSHARLAGLVEQIRATVAATVADVEVVGDPVDRLPHIVTFSCLYVDGEALLHALDKRGFAVSSGSACTSDTLRPSHVLAAMGVLTHGNVRLSLHDGLSTDDVHAFLTALPDVVATLRAEAGVADL
jgi:cysteine desulfurase